MIIYYTTHIFLMLISSSFQPVVTLINRAVLLIANTLTLAVFYIFLICANGSLTLLTSLIL